MTTGAVSIAATVVSLVLLLVVLGRTHLIRASLRACC